MKSCYQWEQGLVLAVVARPSSALASRPGSGAQGHACWGRVHICYLTRSTFAGWPLCYDLLDRGPQKGDGQLGPAGDPPLRSWTGVAIPALPDVIHDLRGGTESGEYVESLGLGDQPAVPQSHRCPGESQQAEVDPDVTIPSLQMIQGR